MENLHYKDAAYKAQKSKEYHLSVQIGNGGYALAVLSPKTKSYIVLQNEEFPMGLGHHELVEQVRGLLRSHEYLSADFASVSVVLLSQRFAMVPQEYHRTEDQQEVLAFNHHQMDDDQVVANRLARAKARCLFALPKAIRQAFLEKHPQAKFFHVATPMVENQLEQALIARPAGKPFVAASVQRGLVEVMAVEKGTLMLYNCFRYSSPQDLAYLVLNAYRQLQLDRRTAPLYLSGHILEHDPAYQILDRYVQNLRFEELDNAFVYSSLFDIYQHTFWNLFNLYKCESSAAV